VVDDSDPRIEQVREEDFPFGTLVLDEEDEKECQKRERHRKRDQQRANQLAQCERAWDQSTVEYRQQCLLVQQRKRAAALALEQNRGQQERRTRVNLSGPGARSLLSCKSPSFSTPGGSHPLEYSAPTKPASPVDIPSRSPRSSDLRRESLSIPTPSQSISFRQVRACMNDALFPNDDAPTDLPGRKRQSHAHAALLEVLLQPVAWERGERSEARIRRRSSLPSLGTWSSSGTLCSVCSSTSGSPSTATLGSSQSGCQIADVRRPTIPAPPNPTACAASVPTRPAVCTGHSLTPIDLRECPLFFQKCSRPQSNAPPSVLRPRSRSHFAKRLVRKIGISVSTFMDVATQFQASYLRSTGFIVQLEDDPPFDETSAHSWATPAIPAKAKAKSKAKALLPFTPNNPRAKISEVTAFIEGSTWSEETEDTDTGEEHYTLVQLLSPSERRSPSPSTTSRLSAFVTPSPLRPREVPTILRYRIRPIANPVLLRLKALQNVCAVEGVEWEGRAREGALGYGCDRLHGVAFDGIGRSRLGLEVSF